jgi:hypothetical protein
MEGLGRPRLSHGRLGRKELAQGLADDLVAAGFEAETGLQGIEVTVEGLA